MQNKENKEKPEGDNFTYLYNFMIDIGLLILIGYGSYQLLGTLGVDETFIFMGIIGFSLYTGYNPNFLRENFSFFYLKK
jgi:hypothetical protein